MIFQNWLTTKIVPFPVLHPSAFLRHSQLGLLDFIISIYNVHKDNKEFAIFGKYGGRTDGGQGGTLRTDHIPRIPRQVAHTHTHNDLSISKTFPHFCRFLFPCERSRRPIISHCMLNMVFIYTGKTATGLPQALVFFIFVQVWVSHMVIYYSKILTQGQYLEKYNETKIMGCFVWEKYDFYSLLKPRNLLTTKLEIFFSRLIT